MHEIYVKGLSAGRKQRQRDRFNNTYPRAGLPQTIAEQAWIEGFQESYYKPKRAPKDDVSIRADAELLRQAAELGVSRAQALETGLKEEIKKAKKCLKNVLTI
jgi:hypothetical protein